jgi:hypothetical protein
MARYESAGAELDAILALGQVLTRLQDAERQRVLRWAIERFGVMAAADSLEPVISLPDLACREDDLDDLFASPASMAQLTEPLNDELSDLFEEPVDEIATVVDVVADMQSHRQPDSPQSESGELPLVVLVADFVSEFRRLAVECDRA